MKGRVITFLLFTLICLADTALAFDAATSLVLSGSNSVVAGSPSNLTITAADTLGSVDTNYDGVKSIVFSGAPASFSPVQNPTVTDQNGVSQDFGTPTGIAFKKGVASVSGTANNGQMRIFRAGSFTISATDGTLASAGTGNLLVNVTPGPLSGFDVAVTSPQKAGTSFTGTNTIATRDSFGNPITDFDASKNSVTLTSSLGGTITGLGSAANNVLNQSGDFTSGVASLTSKLTYLGPGGNGTLLAVASNGKSGVSNAFLMLAADPARLAFVQQPTNALVGAVIAPPVTVQLQDAGGTNVAQAGVSITLSLGSGSGSLGGTVQQTTDSTGLATFGNLTVSDVGSKQLAASATGLTGATSQSFTITAGTAAKLVLQTQPSPTATAGVVFNPQPVIAITDNAGNVVTTDNSTVVTVQESAGGPGGLTGTLSITAANGIVSFTNLAETKASTVSLQLPANRC